MTARRFSRFCGTVVVRRPRVLIAAYALLAALSVWGATVKLRFKTEQNDLVGADAEYNQRYLAFLEEFGDLEHLYVVIRAGGDPGRAMKAADLVQAELERLRQVPGKNGAPLVESVFHRLPAEAMRWGLPLRRPGELERLAAALEERRAELEAFARAATLAELFEALAGAFRPERLAREPAGGHDLERWGLAALEATAGALEEALAGGDPGSLRGRLEEAIGLSPRQRGYLSTQNGELLFVEVLAGSDLETVEIIKEPLLAIREALEHVRRSFPDVEMGLTGRPVLQADEMITTARDMRVATVVALAGVLALFVLFFRRLRRPLFAVLTLGLSIIITLGLVSITIGHLTILSVVFTAMLVGLGIDFGIHFVARYQEELLGRRDAGAAILATLESTGASIATGGVTTAAAFYTLLLVDFKGLRELGFIAGSGVLVCLLSMLTFLPALLMLADGRSLRRGALESHGPLRVPLLERLARRPRLTLGAFAGLAGLGLFGFEWLPYDANLLELQAKGLESVRFELLLIEESDFSTWYCAFPAESEEELSGIIERLRPAQAAGIAGEVESVLDYLPENESRTLPLLARMWRVARGVRFSQPSPGVDAEHLGESLATLADGLDELASLALQRGETAVLARLEPLILQLERLAKGANELNPGGAMRLGAFQERWLGELQELLGSLAEATEPVSFTPGDLPPSLRRRLSSSDGSRYLVYAYPKQDIWQPRVMEQFVEAMTRVDPEVTGAPIQVHESSRRMREGFVRAALYSLLVSFVFLLLDLLSLRLALLAMLPLASGLLLLFELLPVAGLHFNLANFFALPILIGCGVDGGVHIVHRYRDTRSVPEVLRTTCSAVTLSFLTSMLGFGAMVLAEHRGVRSLGWMMLAGLSTILLASIVVLPAALELGQKSISRLQARSPGVE
jgi:hopanoid biosynthesis associated RND transporter like protein HpnN